VTDQGQPIHEQRVADEVDLLAEAAEAVGSSEEQGVLEVPVDRFGVVPACVQACEVGIAGRNGPDVLGSVEVPGPVLAVRMDLRDLARRIYPPLLADQGLAAALEAQVRRSPVQVTVDSDGIGRYSREVEAAMYFCALEALNNVSKYADATSVHVSLSEDGDDVQFRIRDDGRGFDPALTNYGTGLQGMADRLDTIGGTLEVRSEHGAGTTVVGRIPVAERSDRG
jgi:histidine kinase/DNA gyrase B/HSP90-like ATPase